MSKKPIDFVIETAKTNGPKVAKYIKDNPEVVLKVAPFIPLAVKKVKDFQDNRKKKSTLKLDVRKTKYKEYQTEILINLSDYTRLQLLGHKNEVESFIEQIKNEEMQEFALKKSLHSKRTKEWEKILIQIIDKIALLDYQEFIKVFNNPGHTSLYFEGMERQLAGFKRMIGEDDIEAIRNYVFEQTGKKKEDIAREFV